MLTGEESLLSQTYAILDVFDKITDVLQNKIIWFGITGKQSTKLWRITSSISYFYNREKSYK